MKKEIGNKIKLGLFVTAGIIFFIIGIFYIGQKQQMFSRTFSVKFKCKDVNGLQAGNNVRFSGITVGTVQTIQIVSDTMVQVELVIDKDVKKFMKKDAQASVGAEGLMGDKIVSIAPGTAGKSEIEDGDMIMCVEGNSMEEIMAQIKIVATNAAVVTGDLALITGNIRNGKGTIGKLFMDSTMAGNLDQSLANVKQGTKGFQENMEAAKHNFLLKGYFTKKEKEEKKLLEDKAKGEEKEQKLQKK